MQPDGPTAIVADDHELFRVALSELLTRQHGFARVIEVASLDEALERLGDGPDIALALFDLMMPGMRGAGCLEAVRRVFPGVRVVVVSGSEARADILQALAAGVHGYIPKTLRLAGIGAAIRQVLDGGIYAPPSLAELPPEAEAREARPTASHPSPPSALPELTVRQREVLGLLGQGRSNKEIARTLGLGSGTVKVHVAAVLRLLNVSNRAAAAAAAAGLLDATR